MKILNSVVFDHRHIFTNFQDTTDYSSSDQYEKVSLPFIQQQRLISIPGPHLDVLMSNPQVNKFLTIVYL